MLKADKVIPIQFELPGNSLSIGDLVGRAARFVRINYRFVFELYLIPVTLYVLCGHLLVWLSKHIWAPVGGLTSNFALDPRVLMFVALFFLNWFCIWWLRVKTLTLWFLMTGLETTSTAATKKARDFRLIWIYLPTVFIELTVSAWSTLLFIFCGQFDTGNLPSRSAAWQMLGYTLGLLILWVLPFRMLATLNLFPAYNALVSEESIIKGFSRFWFYCRQAPMSLLFATFATAIVIDSMEVPILLPAAISSMLQVTHILSEDMIEWMELIPRTVMEIPIMVVSSGMSAAFAVLLDNQLKIKLEGRDITSSLDQFIAKAG